MIGSITGFILRILPSGRQPLWLRYIGSTAIVGAAFILRMVIGGPLDAYPFLLFIPAVFLCALYFEHGSGVWATFLTTALVAYWLPPRNELWITDAHVIPLALFTGICLLIAFLTEALHVAVRRIRQSEAEMELLLREMGHRSKNNLQMICSMLTLQANSIPDPDAKHALTDTASRVRVMARAQDRLQVKDGHDAIDVDTYLNDLCEDLENALAHLRPIKIRAQLEPLQLDQATAVSIGLLVNELVANAFEHAFTDAAAGIIEVSLRRVGDGTVEVVVRDNGKGCPSEVPAGLGRRLMNLIVLQLEGSIRWESAGPGCSVTVRLPLKLD